MNRRDTLKFLAGATAFAATASVLGRGMAPWYVVGPAALRKVGRDIPVIVVDPLDMAGSAQRLETPNVGADKGIGITADAVDCGSRPLQMRGWAIDAILAGDVHDIAVCGPWT